MDGVLLLGGASATGKTRVALELSRRLDADHVRLDDLWIVSRSVVTRDERPALHFFGPDIHEALRHEVEELHGRQREVSATLAAAVETPVSIQLTRERPTIVEGMWLAPAHAARMRDRWPGRVRAAFLSERDERRIAATMLERREFDGYGGFDERERAVLVRLSVRYDEWVRREANRAGLPLVPSRPAETLVDRILASAT